jgi:hypothetical protein
VISREGELESDFFGAFAAACRASKIRLWANLEVYKTGPEGCKGDQPQVKEPFQVSTIDQLRWQFTIASRNPVTNKLYDQPLFEGYVAFDIFHYLNSTVPDGFGTASPRIARTMFFNDYKRVFINNEFKP